MISRDRQTSSMSDQIAAINLADYTALRAYNGNKSNVYVTGYLVSAEPSGIAGTFVRDDSDTTSTDNGCTIIVAANGKRWKRFPIKVINTGFTGTKGDGVIDDTSPLINSVTNLLQRGKLEIPAATAYKITDTVNILGKAGAVINFGNQQINAGNFESPAKTALLFKGNSEARISDIYLIGNSTHTSEGVYFSADVSNITIHAVTEKIRVANCVTGVLVGSPTYQMSDSHFVDTYASDCVDGFKQVGENTLAMWYGRLGAYNNSRYGIHFEHGGCSVGSLQTGSNLTDIFFGTTNGTDQSKLARIDIISGYSEEGLNGERFIDSAVCTDTNPFREQITISNFRCTPFSSTNVEDFIRWRMNGDLILHSMNVNHGTQLPYISVDHNTAYRAPRVEFDGVIDCSPPSAVQVPMTYKLTDPRQVVEINAAVNNGMTFWQNNGAANEGLLKRGIYMHKLKKFEAALLSVGNLVGAWNLRDITSGQCLNLIPGGPALSVSATLERRDFWLDDGLIGFFRNATTSKTISTSSATYAVATGYTFGAILRPVTVGSAEENTTSLGGVGGIRIAINDTSGGSLLCIVGAANAFSVPANPYDPHLVIGRYESTISIKVDAINLRTGAIVSGVTVAGVPDSASLTWANGISLRNDVCVRGFPFVYNRSLTDIETRSLLQAALLLTDSWRLS